MDANWTAAARALGGGVMIGLAAWLLLAAHGRVAGISGIAASALSADKGAGEGEGGAWRWLFLGGLVLGGSLTALWLGAATIPTRPVALLAGAGLLVGVGTVLGSGCTSGHGVCGLGRRSLRSLVATCVFMAVGLATVAVVRL